MWYTCFVCHKTYAHKCNLKRQIDTSHMLRLHKCQYCMKEYKRREYLNRHLKTAHKTSSNTSTFSNIADCVTTDNSQDATLGTGPVAPATDDDWDDVDTFLDKIDIYSSVAPNAVSVESPITNPVNASISVCTQTDICTLPPVRQLTHMGTNTTPIFSKDKATQEVPIMEDVGNTPHIHMTSPKGPIQGWDSPVTSLPHTPCYYTVQYQERRRAMDLPEAVPYQGPTDEEDPFPPHLSPDPPQWGTVTNKNTPPFRLMDFLDSICSNITPPVFIN